MAVSEEAQKLARSKQVDELTKELTGCAESLRLAKQQHSQIRSAENDASKRVRELEAQLACYKDALIHKLDNI